MRILHDFAFPGRTYPGQSPNAPALAVLLPGALMQPEDFIRQGFVDAVRRRRLPLDLALADPGLRYIAEATDGSALKRLEDDVMRPALLGSYREIWLVGLSIGGFMAMAYADRYPGRASGLCLLSPYPGNRMLAAEVRAAGGVSNWRSGTSEQEGDDESRIWRWLATCGQEANPEIHMGYGADDRFAAGQELIAQALSAHCVDIIPGAHDWPAWARLWENFLDRTSGRFSALAGSDAAQSTNNNE